MSRRRKRRQGTGTLFQKLLNGNLTENDTLTANNRTDTHHPIERGKGGNNKKSNKKEVNALDHTVFHFFTKDLSLCGLADKISNFIDPDNRFFVVNINDPLTSIIKINNWIKEFGDGEYAVKIKISRKSKIIKFRPLHLFATKNLSS